MAKGTWLLFHSLWLYLALATEGEVLPWAPDVSPDHPEDILQILNDLKGTLQNQPPCNNGRLDKMWDAIAKRKTFFEESLKSIETLLDDMEPMLSDIGKSKNCTHCYLSHTNRKWFWWRSRMYCWAQRSYRMITVENIGRRSLQRVLERHEPDWYWLGVRSSPDLEFPKWVAEDGKVVLSDDENATTIPRRSPTTNCLGIHSGNYTIAAFDCEDKLLTACQYRGVDISCGDERKLVEEPQLTWRRAKRHCNSERLGDIAKVEDFSEMQQCMAGKIESENWKVWTGGKIRGEGTVPKWEDNTDIDFTTGHHDPESQGDCLVLTSGRYTSAMIDCGTQLPFLCYSN